MEYKPIATEENIEYAFQKLILAVMESMIYKPYAEDAHEYKNILMIIFQWLTDFVNNKNLKSINYNEFKNVQQKLFELDNKYLNADGLYAEDAYEWILQLEIILSKYNKEKW